MLSSATIINSIISIGFLLALIKPVTKKKWSTVSIILVLFIVYILWRVLQMDGINKNLSATLLQKDSRISELETDNKQLRDRIIDQNTLGVGTLEGSTQKQNITDFIRDWDTSDFYSKTDGTFCPSQKGDRNYQRMYYKPGTPQVNNKMKIKFRMINETESFDTYTQRVVVGTGIKGQLISEFDIPTRDGQIINIREVSENGNLKSKSPGKPISSIIRNGSIINLNLESKEKVGSEIIEVLTINYISKFPEYGDQDDTISNDHHIDDPNPKDGRSSFFIGSYMGGCIQILNWSVI